ncbi:MAG: gluconate 2-dehydrogenase subunit 3 family protein [Rhodomicrobium sp.]
MFFTPAEAETVEAIADRIIPPDPETPGGKDAGCAHFIDNQLAGAYGSSEALYMSGPFQKGKPQQGPQSPLRPADVYRIGIAELNSYCKSKYGGKVFAQLPGEAQDAVIGGLEKRSIPLKGIDTETFFQHLIKNTREGFFADPVYGGNRNMAGWKMIGFSGAHYDYREWVTRHNERYPHPPVSFHGRPGWNSGSS